ncbi:hypothetical protein WYO_5135 [Methylobacterium sp. GXF4]|jgi:hypothetical protein|uniref:DUF3016 domain-containing protein n=1 Tax=Methylobacterium brachiatum TaxID=269660 RepID=A0AAJ1TRF8_9HYPH|nr:MULTISPECIES: hypothetical protein [Methylobacterium]AYO82879.1 hypothetical protein EBB05_11805 [Methylobacterium brachiatum]EIZ82204.1 hypothetical protein WYO_5135 [Methylobacterium sp. GXF4]MCB4800984.1 hypothetical protein [Methylobacterium brachiatum]MDQ0541248.1 hypothetical protein [Methylobacterium brachiatum]
MIASARGWLAGLFLLCGLASAVAAGDFPPTAAFSDIRVDVRPLREAGAGGQADALAADLTAALRKTFAGRIGGRGPRLVVVVKALSLRPYVGGGARRGRGGNLETDYLEGEALLVARDGQVLGRHPQMTATPSSYGGAWYEPDFERRRLSVIADIYAQWLARDLPRD